MLGVLLDDSGLSGAAFVGCCRVLCALVNDSVLLIRNELLEKLEEWKHGTLSGLHLFW